MKRVLIIVFCLSACLADAPQTLRSSVTGVSGVASRTIVVSTHPHHVIYGRTVFTETMFKRSFALQFARAFDGVHAGLEVHSVWSRGEELTFQVAQQSTPYCRSNNCNSELLGTLTFSEQEFTTFSKIGLSARFIGPEAAIDVTVPAHLFRITKDIAAARQFR